MIVRSLSLLCQIFAMLAYMSLAPAGTAAEPPVDFDRDIRPILSENCFFCHGPDAETREAGLRLDQQQSAHEYVIVPGAPADSELMSRIESEDPDLKMPPSDSQRHLSPRQIELIRQWIAQGGDYEQHWSFVPVRLPQVPAVDGGRAQNAIDRFVVARLQSEDLLPSAPADRETLLRRVTLDLTGLPPTPAQIDAYLADGRPDAYERVVDALLQSPRFGECWATPWLDVARYADTYGYQNDRYREMWPWRDWVVGALNANLPYDDFVTWQLAGDLLDDPTRDQVLATAFNRNHRQTNEGGSIEEEFRVEYVADRVNTFGAAFLGLTLECARCHDHKYDPISQRDYYSLTAFFNSIDESGLYSHFTEAVPTPTLLLATPSEQQQIAAIEQQIERAEARLASIAQNRRHAFVSWRNARSLALSSADGIAPEETAEALSQELVHSVTAGLTGDYPLESIEQNQIENRADSERPGNAIDQPETVAGKAGNALRFSGDNGISVPSGGGFTRNDSFSISLWLRAAESYQRAVVFHRSRAWTDSGSRGYELLIEDGHFSAALVHFWPGNALRIVARDPVPVGQWIQITLTYDGSSRAGGLRLYQNGQPLACEVVRDKLTKHIKGADGFPGGDVDVLEFGQRFRDSGFEKGEMDEIRVWQRQLTPPEIVYLHDGRCTADEDDWYSHYLHRHDPRFQAAAEELKRLRTVRSEIVDPIREIMVMREMDQPRPTYLLERGAYESPGPKVARETPESLPPMGSDLPRDRLGLARWLTDRQHPLTARVAVNRIWQSLFGQGLVVTSEDFGAQGSLPEHPELLDWLAFTFMESDWDVKRLIRTIVTSATYRQTSDAAPALRQRDPENLLLARGPSHRLAAEMLRDTALHAGGLLAENSGGPPVKPYQPPGLWEEKSGTQYERDPGAGSHRRSLYTYWKRTSPPPSMMTLDATTREVCTVRRQATATPLQVLVLLNDPQFVEASRGLAERAILTADGDADRQIEFIFRSLTGRRPVRAEREVLQQVYSQQLAEFHAAPDEAERLLATGDHVPAAALDKSELAALSVVAATLFGYDETVMKR